MVVICLILMLTDRDLCLLCSCQRLLHLFVRVLAAGEAMLQFVSNLFVTDLLILCCAFVQLVLFRRNFSFAPAKDVLFGESVDFHVDCFFTH